MKNFLVSFFVFFLPIIVFGASVTINNPLGTNNVQGLITDIIDAILSIVGIVAVAIVVYGGVQIMISGGDAKKLEEGKKTVTYAIIGLVVALLSYAIINFVIGAFQ